MNAINKTQFLKYRGTFFKISLNIFLLTEINWKATANKLKSETTLPVVMVLNVWCVVHFVKIILDEFSNFFRLNTPKFRGDIFLPISPPVLRASAFCSAFVFCDKSSFQRDICPGCRLIGHRRSCQHCSRSSLLQAVSRHRSLGYLPPPSERLLCRKPINQGCSPQRHWWPWPARGRFSVSHWASWYCAWTQGMPIPLGYTRVSVSPTDCCCSG